MEFKKAQKLISAAGLVTLLALFVLWAVKKPVTEPLPFCAALVSAGLFAAVCLRFVPVWISAWRDREKPAPNEPEWGGWRLFGLLLLWDCLIILLMYLIWLISGHGSSFSQYLWLWGSTDSQHYLDIARDWYLSEGSMDRLVQLVFLPGYPLAVRLFDTVIGNTLISGLAVSAVCFALGGCVFYRLLRLELPAEAADRAMRYLLPAPPAFFFAAPMSESLFFLLAVSCLYLMRREKFFASALLGALAAFTRSLGITLLVPLVFELVQSRAKPGSWLSLFILPLGFAAYLGINLSVAGDAFKFMEYQSEHWSQHLGFFWNTAYYQTDRALSCLGSDMTTAAGLWIPNLIACFGSLVIMLFGAKRLRAGYTAWFLAYYIVAIGATWLLSAPRYLLLQLPLYMSLGLMTEDRTADILLTVGSFILFLCYSIAFCMRWQVW